MSDNNHESNELDPNREERKRHEMNEFAEAYFSIRSEMENLEKESVIYYAQRDRFVSQFTPGILALALDFYPEYANKASVVQSLLSDYGELLFEDVDNLCEYYKGDRTDYFRPSYKAQFEIITKVDLFNNRKDIPKYQEIIEYAKTCFEEEYVESFYFQCYRKHIHRMLKRLMPEYIPEIYDLPAQGFRDLDNFLYAAMLEIYEIINEARPENA
ncbi:MAG: hypothetical protein JNK09_00630 [Prolixibacteraceae bacterium]|nr:hypothetical protein [Prolixibacteraceae bacterium]